MKKYFLMLIFLSQFTLAENLKLECNLLIETRHSDGGGVRQRNTIATVAVEMTDSFKSIRIANHKTIAIVDSTKTDNTVSFFDRSDAGKWELSEHIFDARKNIRSNTSIRIDRNTGKIFFNDRFTDSTGYINDSGVGDCTKVDLNKRKF